MGRLINRDRLARAKEKRAIRKQRILEEAGSVFMRMAYSEVTLDTIGQHADVDRGVASMFFRTKEELFLIIFKDVLAEWYESLEQEIGCGSGELSPESLASILARSMAERPALTRFLSLLPVVLEQDIEAMEVFRFQRWRCERLAAVGQVIEERGTTFADGAGQNILYRAHLIAAGLEMASNPRGAAAFDRNDPGFAVLWVDLEGELRELLTAAMDRKKTATGSESGD